MIHDFPDENDIYYFSKIKAVFPLGKYLEYHFHKNNINIMCCAVVTEYNDIMIVTHGDKNGTIYYYNEILDILTDPNFSEYEIGIHCCFPRQVCEKHPELRDYITNNECGVKTASLIAVYSTNLDLTEFALYDRYKHVKMHPKRKPLKWVEKFANNYILMV